MIKVATIINTRGLKGECKLYLITDDVEDRFAKGRILYLDQETEMKVKSFTIRKGLGYAFFEGIDTIEKAEKLKTKELWIKEEDLPELEDDEYYYHQLMGCTVYNQDKENLGIVSDILETGANLVLRISKEDTSFLCPFVNQFVKEVDVQKKEIYIEEMEGLR